MTRTLSLVLATSFVLLGVVILPPLYFLHTVSSPRIVAGELDPHWLYALGLPAVSLEVEKDPVVQSLRGSVLQVTRGDINRFLQGHFTTADVSFKAVEVHQAILDGLRQYPGSLTFYVNVEAEKEVALPAVHGFFKRRLDSREECGVGGFLDIAWMGLKSLFGEKQSEIESLQDLPLCDPSGAVENKILAAVDQSVAEFRRVGRDSIKITPSISGKASRHIRSALLAGPWWALVVAFMLSILVALAWLNLGDRHLLLLRTGTPTLLTGLALLVVAVPLLWLLRDIDIPGMILWVEDPPISEGTGQWLGLVFYVVKSAARASNADMVALGAVLTAAGGGMVGMGRRGGANSE